ncbi:MAG: hypothetical protein AAF193_08195 [Bacteroidota bacterium]
MKQRTIITLLLLALMTNGFLVKYYLFNSSNDLPLFDPFEINYGITENSLMKSGYQAIPEDVPLLGKQVGDTLIYYQLEEARDEHDQIAKIKCKNTRVAWRNCVIPLYQIDQEAIDQLCQQYDAKVISPFEVLDGHRDSTEFRVRFFVKHQFTKEIFECFIDKVEVERKRDKFELSISTSFPEQDNNN